MLVNILISIPEQHVDFFGVQTGYGTMTAGDLLVDSRRKHESAVNFNRDMPADTRLGKFLPLDGIVRIKGPLHIDHA